MASSETLATRQDSLVSIEDLIIPLGTRTRAFDVPRRGLGL